MRIQLLSDLHLEMHADRGKAFVESLDASKCDVLVLAGDICTVADGLFNALSMFAAKFAQVLMVPGNHEYWSSDRGTVNATLQKAKRKHSNLRVMHRDIVTIGGQRFLGTSLWFPPTTLARQHSGEWSDFICIQGFYKWVYEENALDQAFFDRELREGDVAITHYLPSWRSVHPQYAAAASNCYFVCNMEELIEERKPAFWLHGHTHASMNYRVGPTQILCNPFGYAGHELNPKFNDSLIIDLPDKDPVPPKR